VKNLLHVWLFAICATALVATPEPDDTILNRARAMATNSMRPEALAMLQEYLRQHPGDADARVLDGLVLSWEGRYGEARSEFQRVLAAHPNYDDALRGLINVELWSEHPERAEKLTAIALRNRPDDPEYLYNRIRALKVLRREHEAIHLADELLQIQPEHPHAAEIRSELEDQAREWQASVSRTEEWFSDPKIDGWHELQLSLKRRTPILGSVTLRFDEAQRYGIAGHQAEIEIYPHIRRGMYAYLGAGYSYDANWYPHYRIGAELYQNLGHRFEGSVGLRRMAFSTNINVYTASLGRYQGKWLFTGRTYLTPDLNGLSHSIHFSARRYLNDAGDYFGFRVSRGSSLFESVRESDLDLLRATSVTAELSRTVARRWNLTFHAGISQEDRLNHNSLMHYVLDSNLFFRF
jgi:YaiO family outer membrane protein